MCGGKEERKDKTRKQQDTNPETAQYETNRPSAGRMSSII